MPRADRALRGKAESHTLQPLPPAEAVEWVAPVVQGEWERMASQEVP